MGHSSSTTTTTVLCFLAKAHHAFWLYHYLYHVIIALCLIHFVICVTRTIALGSLFGRAWLLLIGLMADKWLYEKRYGLLQGKKEQKLNPGLCRQSHLSSFQYWCPLCLWIIWLSSVLWPSSPCQIGHLGHRPVDNVILTDGFHSLIVSTVFL